MKLGELPPDTMTATCRTVFEDKDAVSLILYQPDDVQILCPKLHGEDANDDCPVRLVHLEHLFEKYPDIPWLKDLDPGEAAFKIDGEWTVEPWELEG